MSHPLRILLVEDCPEDAELLLLELRRGGYNPVAERVISEEEMRAALARPGWDLVISDYVLPGFGGLEALKLFRQTSLDIPFLIVSGHIGEDIAVSAMKAGADDYVMKDRLQRLAPAIERALQEAETRRANRLANQALAASEERFRQLAENIGAAFFMFELPEREKRLTLSYVSPAYEKIWGYPCESLFWDANQWLKTVHPEDKESVLQKFPRILQGRFHEEFRIVRMDLGMRWIQFRAFPVYDQAGNLYRVAALAEDITERKHTEEQLAINARELRQTIRQLRIAEEELRASNTELSQTQAGLERRVQERTADLTAANEELQRQVTERKRLENELLEIAENERRRIGLDLHDDLGQKLMGVSLLLKALEHNLAHRHQPEASDTRHIQDLVHQIINHTHNLAHCFSSLDLPGDDLCVLLKRLVASVRQTFRISCRFHLSKAVPALPPEASHQLYKIAQEAISNAIKHGKASRVVITLAHQDGQLVLRIKNDGVPFRAEREPNKRMGLRIMNYRARTIGGLLHIRACGHSGTVVTCVLPCSNGQPPSRLLLEPQPVSSLTPACEVSADRLLPLNATPESAPM